MTYEVHPRQEICVPISYPIKQADPSSTRFIVELNFKSKFLCPSNDNYKQKILKEFSSTSSMAFLSGMTKHGSYCKKLVFVGTNY